MIEVYKIIHEMLCTRYWCNTSVVHNVGQKCCISIYEYAYV